MSFSSFLKLSSEGFNVIKTMVQNEDVSIMRFRIKTDDKSQLDPRLPVSPIFKAISQLIYDVKNAFLSTLY